MFFQTEAAAGILQALLQLQLQVGKDIALIGYDDLEIAKTNIPPLTTMRPPARISSELLVGILMQIIDGRAAENLQEVWKAKMVVRQSTDRISCNDST